jgi:hypothetical protein
MGLDGQACAKATPVEKAAKVIEIRRVRNFILSAYIFMEGN